MNAITTTEVHEIQAPPQRAVAPISTTPADLVLIAIERGLDMSQIEQFIALQERREQSEARKAYVLAMSLFKAEPMEILKRKQVGYKTREGDFVGYSHAELSDITEVVGPAMAKHGLSFRWDIRQEGGLISVDCIVRHAQGHSETVTMHAPPDASGKKNAIQQVASSVSYLQRYTLLAATGMATKGMDDDGRGSGDDGDLFRLEDWLAKASEAADIDELRDTKERGLAVIRKRKDAPAHRAFLAAVSKRLAELGSREPGQEG
jgi:hypothetical protein